MAVLTLKRSIIFFWNFYHFLLSTADKTKEKKLKRKNRKDKKTSMDKIKNIYPHNCSHVMLERLSIMFTSNGNLVLGDQNSPLLVVYCSLFLHLN